MPNEVGGDRYRSQRRRAANAHAAAARARRRPSAPSDSAVGAAVAESSGSPRGSSGVADGSVGRDASGPRRRRPRRDGARRRLRRGPTFEAGRGEDPFSQSRGVGVEPGEGGTALPAAHDADLGPRVALAHKERAAAVSVARVLRRRIAGTDVEAGQRPRRVPRGPELDSRLLEMKPVLRSSWIRKTRPHL